MRQKSLFTLMLAFLILVPTWITGCEQKVDVSGISNYGEQTITISGLKDREFEVTINEIAQLECVTQSGKRQPFQWGNSER